MHQAPAEPAALAAVLSAYVTPGTPDKQQDPLTVHCEEAPVLTAGKPGHGRHVSKHAAATRPARALDHGREREDSLILRVGEVLPQVSAGIRRAAGLAGSDTQEDTEEPAGRPTRAVERDYELIEKVMPSGAEMAGAYWLAAVKTATRGERLKADLRQRIHDVADAFNYVKDRDTGTAMPGVTRIAELLRLGKRTVQRIIAWLKRRHLLVTTAGGRSAECTPYRQNDREVYALIRPRPGKTGTPSPSEVKDWLWQAVCGGGYTRMPRKEWDRPVWPGNKYPQTDAERALAAQEFMRRERPYTYEGTPADVMGRILQPYFDQGATLYALKQMLSYRPDGTQWPHDGSDGIEDYAAWTFMRLKPWKDAGKVWQP